MFGLMKGRCEHHEQEHRFHRLHYCGTCKTMGSRYGERTRLLLNHDAVFLAELLTLLSDQSAAPAVWDSAYHSWNCFQLPSQSETPIALQFAGAATLLLAEAKVTDHEQDAPHPKWRWARRLLDPGWRRAERDLKSWGVPLDTIRQILADQMLYEQSATAPGPADVRLQRVCHPTAEVTALVFAEGARTVGACSAVPAVRELGAAFGTLTYLLDAWEDRERDLRRQEFNAFTAVYGADAEAAGRKAVEEALSETVAALQALPISAILRDRFAARLASNVRSKLNPGLKVLRQTCTRPNVPFSERWREAKSLATRLVSPADAKWAFLAVAVAALVSPWQVRESVSADQCTSLGANLMFLAAVVDKKRRSGCCSQCDCDGCDSCGEGCNCCCSTVECGSECGNCCGHCGECAGHCGSCGDCCGSCGDCCSGCSCDT